MAESCNLMSVSAALRPTFKNARCYHLLPFTSLSPPLLLRPSLSSLCFHHSNGRGGGAVGGRGAALAVRSMCSTFGSNLEDSIKKTVSENPIVIYSKTWCSYSMEVKSLFKRIGVEPFVIELDQIGPQGPQIQDVLEGLTGQFTVPNVFIGGKHIGGCTDTLDLYHKGELTALLSELNISTKNLQQP